MKPDREQVRGWRSPVDTWAKLRGRAGSFRRAPTDAEKRLWNALRNRQLSGVRFRRQHAIDRYLVDFYCSQAELAVEVDGDVHQQQVEQDRIRQEHLERMGLTFLRFTNDEILTDLDSVIARIAAVVLERGLPLSEVGEGD